MRENRRAPWQWSSDGKGTFTVSSAAAADAPERGTRVVLHLTEQSKQYTERFTLERMVKAQSGHVPVPIAIVDKPGGEPAAVADGSALWTKNMGTPAGASGAGCGNISPLGITGTPVIDEAARTLYLDWAETRPSRP